MVDHPVTQQAFGDLVGVSQQAVSDLVRAGVLPDGGTARQWLTAYCQRLREQAAGRFSEGPLDLAQERAGLARVQRQLAEERLALARGESAPIELLARTLATASQAVAQRLDQLPSQLRKRCPTLPRSASDAVMTAIASARNEWVRQTVELVTAAVASVEDEADQLPLDGDGEG